MPDIISQLAKSKSASRESRKLAASFANQEGYLKRVTLFLDLATNHRTPALAFAYVTLPG